MEKKYKRPAKGQGTFFVVPMTHWPSFHSFTLTLALFRIWRNDTIQLRAAMGMVQGTSVENYEYVST
jgi:hypothetical protein